MSKVLTADDIIKKKKVDLDLLLYHCKGVGTYNAFITANGKKDKYRLTEEEFNIIKAAKKAE